MCLSGVSLSRPGGGPGGQGGGEGGGRGGSGGESRRGVREGVLLESAKGLPRRNAEGGRRLPD